MPLQEVTNTNTSAASAAPVKSTTTELSVGVVTAALAAWGKWSEDGGTACVALYAEDCEATMPPIKTRPEYKTYKGRDGIVEWVEFLATNLEFQEFEVISLAADPADASIVHGRFSCKPKVLATGKQLPDAMIFDNIYHVHDGKISKQELDFGDISLMEELWDVAQAEAGITTVGAALAAWGRWAEDDGAACLALYAEGCEVVVAPVVKGRKGGEGESGEGEGEGVPGYGRRYKGREGVRAYVEFISAELNFEDYQVTGITADTAGLIHLGYTYQPTVKATGKQCSEEISGEAIYRLNEEDGKLLELRLPAWGAKFEEMYQ